MHGVRLGGDGFALPGFGGPDEDMTFRELFTLAPLGAIVIFLGIYPTAILDLQSPALLRLNEQVRAATTAPAPDMVAVAQTPRAASLGSEERNARSERAPQGTPE